MNRVIAKVFKIFVLGIFGIVPSFMIALLSLGGVVSDGFGWRIYYLLVASAAAYGTYSLVRHIIGQSSERSHLGKLSGLLSMLAFASAPLVHELLEMYLQLPSPITNSGLAGIWSLIAMFPFVVYSLLLSETPKRIRPAF